MPTGPGSRPGSGPARIRGRPYGQQHRLGPARHRDPVHRPGVEEPAGAVVRHPVSPARDERPAKEAASGVGRVRALQLGILRRNGAAQPGGGPGDQVGVAAPAPGAGHRGQQRGRERPPLLALQQRLLGRLVGPARGQQHVTGLAAQVPAGRTGPAGGSHQVAGGGPAPLVARGPAHPVVARAARPHPAARMAAVQHDQHVRPARADLGDQARQLLVGQVPARAAARVVAEQGLVQPVRLGGGQLGGGGLLRAVPGVPEQRDVTRPGRRQVIPEPGHHRVPGGLLVQQQQRGWPAHPVVEHGRQQLGDGSHVVHTAGQLGHPTGVPVDADQQGVDRRHDRSPP